MSSNINPLIALTSLPTSPMNVPEFVAVLDSILAQVIVKESPSIASKTTSVPSCKWREVAFSPLLDIKVLLT